MPRRAVPRGAIEKSHASRMAGPMTGNREGGAVKISSLPRPTLLTSFERSPAARASLPMTRRRLVLSLGLTVLLTQCASRDDPGANIADAGQTNDDHAAECQGPCPVCSEGYGCVRDSSFGVQIVPLCLKICTSSADCNGDEMCLGFASERHCVASSMPATCKPLNSGAHCDWNSTSCEGNILLTFVSRRGAWCGVSYEDCPRGCEGTYVDAGTHGYTTGYCL